MGFIPESGRQIYPQEGSRLNFLGRSLEKILSCDVKNS